MISSASVSAQNRLSAHGGLSLSPTSDMPMPAVHHTARTLTTVDAYFPPAAATAGFAAAAHKRLCMEVKETLHRGTVGGDDTDTYHRVRFPAAPKVRSCCGAGLALNNISGAKCEAKANAGRAAPPAARCQAEPAAMLECAPSAGTGARAGSDRGIKPSASSAASRGNVGIAAHMATQGAHRLNRCRARRGRGRSAGSRVFRCELRYHRWNAVRSITPPTQMQGGGVGEIANQRRGRCAGNADHV